MKQSKATLSQERVKCEHYRDGECSDVVQWTRIMRKDQLDSDKNMKSWQKTRRGKERTTSVSSVRLTET